MRVPWTARRSNQSILKEISPRCSLEGLMLKLKLQYFGHLMRRCDSLEKTPWSLHDPLLCSRGGTSPCFQFSLQHIECSVNSLLDSVGEGEGGMIWENGIETCIISCMKRVASLGSMHDMDAWVWCTGTTQRDGMGRKEGSV